MPPPVVNIEERMIEMLEDRLQRVQADSGSLRRNIQVMNAKIEMLEQEETYLQRLLSDYRDLKHIEAKQREEAAKAIPGSRDECC